MLTKNKNVQIDKERNYVLERITESRIKESDHNAIILYLSLKSQNQDKIIPKEFQKFKWAITDKPLQNFKKQTQNVTFNVDEQET